MSRQGLDPSQEAGKRVMRVLGIETSCDETAAAIVARDAAGKGTILSNVVRSQLEEHAAYGGVVPELAARAHVELIDGVIEAALEVTRSNPLCLHGWNDKTSPNRVRNHVAISICLMTVQVSFDLRHCL